MLRHALAVAVLCALAACDRAPTTAAPAAPTPAVAAAPTSGIDLAGIDKSVKPGDDFDLYANGAWKKAPRSRPTAPAEHRLLRVREGREAQRGTHPVAGQGQPGGRQRRAQDRRLLRRLHGRGGHRTARPRAVAAGTGQGRGHHRRGRAVALFGQSLRADTDPLNSTNYDTENLFGLFVAQGLEDPGRNVGPVLQGGLGMPDREYYRAGDEDMAGNRGLPDLHREAARTGRHADAAGKAEASSTWKRRSRKRTPP